MSNKVPPVNKCKKKKTMPAEMMVIFMLPLQQMLCVVPMQVNKTFRPFFLIGSVHSSNNSFYLNHLTGMRSLFMTLTPLCHR